MSVKEYIYDLVGFGIGTALSLTFFGCVKAGQEISKLLKDSSVYNIDIDLVKKIKESEIVEGCFCGKVKAEQFPIHSIQKPEITGVIWRQIIKEYNVTQIMGLWMNDENLIDESTRSVPFSLFDNGIYIQVCTPSQLERVDLSLIGEKFETANISLGDHFIGWLKGIRPTGTKYIEEMLVQDSKVLGIGKVVSNNRELLFKPSPPLPFILTTQDKMGVIDELEASLSFYRFMGIVTAGGALYFLIKMLRKLFNHMKDVRQKKELERILKESKIRRSTQDNDLPENLMCVICCGLRDVVLMPCKHICVCGDCSLKLDPRICPVCRTKIKSIEPVFYS